MLQDVYSIRNIKEIDIFEYENPSDKFKQQIFYLMKDSLVINEFVNLYKSITLHSGIKRNIKETYLENPSIYQDYFISGFEKLIEKQDDIEFYLDRACFHGVNASIDSRYEVTLSPEDDVEIRKIILKNTSTILKKHYCLTIIKTLQQVIALI